APDVVAPAVVVSAAQEATATTRRAHADLDPVNDLVVGPPAPVPDCEAQLKAAGVTFKPARIGLKKVDGVPTCGAEQVVRFKRGPGRIAYGNAPLLTCAMAIALADFELVLQEEAERELGSRVVRIDHLGTFNCRQMAAYDLISEHSFANGIDLRRFHLADGREVDVLKHFRPDDDAPTDARTTFLRKLGNRLFDDDVFSNVVTPYFDKLHRNHIHVDLARYRVDGSRP
ncbi:MAG TPA: extensin family protein, partial [Nannocystaceae bacterium]|nr:extensin family protein [Nannocystaceae bacterium]